MCVICIKPDGVDLPTSDRMRAMFDSNSDGAGFMFARNGVVTIRKGFMKFKHLCRAIRQENIQKSDVCVFHFRIATSGSAAPKNCHPFPLSESIADLRSLRIETDMAMAHNGILSYASNTVEDMSDTMTFVQEILADPAIKDNLLSPSVWVLLEMSVGSSKLVFLQGDGKFSLLGDWDEDKTTNDGLFYSNLLFRWRETTNNTPYRTPYWASREFQEQKRLPYHGGGGKFISSPCRCGNTAWMIEYNGGDRQEICTICGHIKDLKVVSDQTDFAANQEFHMVKLYKEDKACPNCLTPFDANDRSLCCTKCGKIFNRDYDD